MHVHDLLQKTEATQVPALNKNHPSLKSIQLNFSTDGVKKAVLKNGMTVLVYQNKSIPKVLVQTAYNVGSYVEKAGERGLAHLIEHMIFKGTQKLSETDIDVIARKYGASYNAFTSMDVTSYYFETNKNNWKPFMTILADCMKNARFNEQHLASELKAVIQELKMYKDSYWRVMLQKINELEYPANHPYHYTTIGYKEDLMNISASNLKNFYQKYYHPDRAALLVVGDVDSDEAIEQARLNFESIEGQNGQQDFNTSITTQNLNMSPQDSKTPPARTDSSELFPELAPDLVVHDTCWYEDVTTEKLGFYWRIPGLKDTDEVLSTAASFLLGDGEGSRLHRALVDEAKVASSVSVFAQKYMESGIFLILIEPQAGKSEACKAVVERELIKAGEYGFSEHELTHMMCAEGKSFFHKLENFGALTFEWLMSFFATGDEYALFNRVSKVNNVQSDQVQQFIQNNLDPLFMNQIRALPLPASKKEAYQEGKRRSDELDQKILEKYKRTVPIEAPRFALTMAKPNPVNFVFPKPDRELVLPNGLKVLLRVNKALPLITLQCKFKESAYFSSALESFPVNMMMNMLMEESKGYTKRDNVDFFEFYGAQYGFGSTGGMLSLLSAAYQPLFERFVHVLLNPTFPALALEKLKAIDLDGFKRAQDDPSTVANRQLNALIYKNHPFGWTLDNAIESIKNISVADLIALHSQYITPSNMIVAISGDFDLDEMENTVRTVFGIWQPGSTFKAQYPERSFTANEVVSVPMVRDQVVVCMGQPSTVNMYNPDLVPLKLLNYIAFYSLGSRIFNLRQQSGLFYTASGTWAAQATSEAGFDYMGTIVNPENVDSVQAQMRALINDLAQNGVTQQELEAAQLLYLKALIDAVSTNKTVADLLIMLSSYNLGFDYYDKVLARAQGIEVAELNSIASRYFNADKMSLVKVGRVG